MPLKIETFDNAKGGNSFYKAVSHPEAASLADTRLLPRLRPNGPPIALYDPLGFASGLAEFYPALRTAPIAGIYVQDLAAVGEERLGLACRAIPEVRHERARTLLVVAFDADRLVRDIRDLVPPGMKIVSLDDVMRLPADRLSVPARYLDPLNFVTNFAFFRDADGLHTRLTTANYWARYGSASGAIHCRLFGERGETLAAWEETLPAGEGIVTIDSREVRRRFGLGPFAGQLFVHAKGARGHDVFKYALDTLGDEAGPDSALSATHDANAWPSHLYAGLPAALPGERVVLWLQNSHPTTIEPGELALAPMGDPAAARAVQQPLGPFASLALDVAELFPQMRWPAQLEVVAGKHMVRPRYEILAAGRHRRIAHVNVERSDLVADPALPRLRTALGKGFILPAPVLPRAQWRGRILPTPMSTAQSRLALVALVYDKDGREAARHRLGNLGRGDVPAFDMDELADGLGDYGHVELAYDFDVVGAEGDGWLHAIFRYESRDGGHAAETSFGAHIFNTAVTWRGEPQSYTGRPPGLSTRLFLRLPGDMARDGFCHLIYPASAPWRPRSETDFILHDGGGGEIARERVEIACSGSLFRRWSEMFDAAMRARAGKECYVVIRDSTCRLFGYHGLLGRGSAFSLDHMFGF